MQLNELFTNVYGNTADMTLTAFLLCLATAFFIGGALANIVMHQSNCSKSFAITLALMPMTICVIVLLISDNFGAGLAIAGAFALIRFKSSAGSGKEIAAILIAVAAGIACGMGYNAIALVFAAVVLFFYWLYSRSGIWVRKKDDARRSLTVSYKFTGQEDTMLPKILELVRPFAGSLTQTRSHVKYAGSGKYKATMEYDLSLNTEQTDTALTDCLKKSGLKIEFELTKQKSERPERL